MRPTLSTWALGLLMHQRFPVGLLLGRFSRCCRIVGRDGAVMGSADGRWGDRMGGDGRRSGAGPLFLSFDLMATLSEINSRKLRDNNPGPAFSRINPEYLIRSPVKDAARK